MEDADWLALDQQSLQQVVRERPWVQGLPPTTADITEGLKAAGIDPQNETERERFRRLAVAQAHFADAEERSRLGDYIDKACADMPDATEDEVRHHACYLRDQDEHDREALAEPRE